jgi:hypothetical protein
VGKNEKSVENLLRQLEGKKSLGRHTEKQGNCILNQRGTRAQEEEALANMASYEYRLLACDSVQVPTASIFKVEN